MLRRCCKIGYKKISQEQNIDMYLRFWARVFWSRYQFLNRSNWFFYFLWGTVDLWGWSFPFRGRGRWWSWRGWFQEIVRLGFIRWRKIAKSKFQLIGEFGLPFCCLFLRTFAILAVRRINNFLSDEIESNPMSCSVVWQKNQSLILTVVANRWAFFDLRSEM